MAEKEQIQISYLAVSKICNNQSNLIKEEKR